MVIAIIFKLQWTVTLHLEPNTYILFFWLRYSRQPLNEETSVRLKMNVELY